MSSLANVIEHLKKEEAELEEKAPKTIENHHIEDSPVSAESHHLPSADEDLIEKMQELLGDKLQNITPFD